MDQIKHTYVDFLLFLEQNNIIKLGLAFIIGTQVNQLASTFIDNIITPIIQAIFIETGGKQFKDYRLRIFGIHLEIGQFISSLLKFILLMVVLFYTIKLMSLIKPAISTISSISSPILTGKI